MLGDYFVVLPVLIITSSFCLSIDCPNLDLLRAFNEGRINDIYEIDRISDHLGSCKSCIRELDQMEPSSLALGLRNAEKHETVGDEDDMESPEGFSAAMTKISSQFMLDLSEQKQKALGEDRYQILGVIGEGNFGDSFLARLDSRDLFAIKIPFAKKLTTRLHNDQFLKDCRAAQSLEHPNISVPVDFGDWDSKRVFYATAYIGLCPSLKRSAKDAISDDTAKFHIDETIRLFDQLLDVLSHAHSKQVLHRHLSPENIWIAKDRSSITVTDFGFVLDSRYHFELLEPLEIRTPFLAPESINNDANYIDVRSDIYSVGRILKLLMRVTLSTDDEFQKSIKKIIVRSTQPRRSDRYQTIDRMMGDWAKAIQLA